MGRPRRPEKIINGEKHQQCGKCLEYKVYDDFILNKRRHNGINASCRKCNKKKNPKSPGRKPNPVRVNTSGQQEKLCTGCNEFKTFDCFNAKKDRVFGIDSRCRDCVKSKTSYKETLEKQKVKVRIEREALHNHVLQDGKECNNCNEHLNSSAFDFSNTFKDGFQRTCRECKRIKRNKASSKAKAARIKRDPVQRLKRNMRRAVISAFRYAGSKKNSRTYKIIGMDADSFWNYLKKVSSTNPDIEKCHMDHIIPISLAQSEEEVLALSHYSNCQWLAYDENIRKRHHIVKADELMRVTSLNPYPKAIDAILKRNDLEIISTNYKY